MKKVIFLLLAAFLVVACKKSEEPNLVISDFDTSAIGKVGQIAEIAEDYFEGFNHLLTNHSNTPVGNIGILLLIK